MRLTQNLRRSTVVLAAAAGALLLGSALPTAVAVAPNVTTTSVSRGALPPGWTSSDTCASASTFGTREGPTGQPLGMGSFEVSTVGDGGGIAAVRLPVYGINVLALGGLSASYSVTSAPAPDPMPDSGYATLTLVTNDPATPDVWTYLTLSGGAAQQGWTTLDLYAAQARILDVDQVTKATTDRGSMAFGLYRATNPSDMVLDAILGAGCWAASTVAWDDVRITVNGVETRYDLEPAVAATLSSGVSTSTATYGSSATVTGSLVRDSGATPIAGAEVELWAKPSGAADFALLTTATSTAGGSLSATVRPTKATQYRWQLPAASAYTGSPSAARTVSVRAALSLNKVASSVVYPAPVVLFGAAKPLPAGTTVTLRRGSTAIGTAAVRADGTFAFAKKLARGSYTFTVSVPSVAGYAAATSPKVSVTVS